MNIILTIILQSTKYLYRTLKNNFKIKLAHINTSTNELSGKDISINLNNLFFDKNNEPSLKEKVLNIKMVNLKF